MPDTNPSVRYEKGDVRATGIILAGLLLVWAIVLGHYAAVGLFGHLKESERRKNPPLPELAAKERPRLPQDLKTIPEPRLQTTERLDLAHLRQAEDDLLNGYGWVDRKAGIVRIPVAEAMRLLADPKSAEANGLRVRAIKGAKK
jgi:hypothetical protein